MDLIEILSRLKKQSITLPYKEVWQGIFLRLNIYISGIKPNYCIPKDDVYKSESYRSIPEHDKYTPIFDNEIFCRYPHDSIPQLNFRKSIAHIDDMKSLCDKFFQQSKSIIFQGNNFHVSSSDKVLQDWLNSVRIDGFRFHEWIKEVLYPTMLNDPNALAIVVESHERPFPASEKAIPIPKIIGSEEIYYIGHNTLVVDDYAFDSMNQYMHEDYEVIEEMTYNHRLNELPVVQLGGRYVRKHVWQSFIQAFVGIANSYVQEKSDVVLAKKTLAPRLQIISSDCATCNGSGFEEKAQGRVPCVQCKGKGRISINLGDIVDVPENRATIDDKIANLDRFKYTTPDPEYIRLLNEDADKEFARAEKSLFIYRKETAASESGNNLDKQFEEKKIFFQSISDRLYYVVGEILRFASMYLNYNAGQPKPSDFIIDKPIDFDLSSADDVLNQYANERKQLLPITITNVSELNYVKKVFGDNSVMLKKLAFLQMFDPLYGKGSEYVSTMASVDPFDIVTHNYLASLLDLYIAEITPQEFLNQAPSKTWDSLKPRIEEKAALLPNLI